MGPSRLVAFAMTFLMAVQSVVAKQLILLAGPRQKGNRDFFYQHATGLDGSESLRGWRWPTVSDEDFDLLLRESAAKNEISKGDIFRLLFDEEENSLVQQVLLDAIRESYENSVHGIMLGEEWFSYVGVDQFTSNDASKIIYRLMENLSITPRDITIVLMYETPRIQEWASIWDRESSDQSYYDFLCNSEEEDDRLKHLETAMNPFRLSKIYREFGWNVAIVDEKGVRNSGFDPAHAIACEILDASCEEGWVAGMKEETSRAPRSHYMDELNEYEKDELEQLFLSRDCLYKQELEVDMGTNQFRIVNQEHTWSDCKKHYSFDFKEAMGDSDFFLDAIRSQRGCGRGDVDLSDVLAAANSSNFTTALWLLIFGSIFCLAGTSGILFVRFRKGKEDTRKGDGLFRKDSELGVFPKALCNKSKFVRFDPKGVFCVEGKRISSSESGKETDRKAKEEQSSDIALATDETKSNDDLDPHIPQFVALDPQMPRFVAKTTNIMASGYLDGSMFVSTTHVNADRRNRTRRGKKDKEQKSKVVKKLSELLVLKNGDGDKFNALSGTSDFRFLDEIDKDYV